MSSSEHCVEELCARMARLRAKIAIFALMMTLSSQNLLCFSVLRPADLTITQYARNIVGDAVPNDVVLNLTDFIGSAQRELTDSQMRELELKAQVRELRSNCRELRSNCSFLEKDNVHLQRELLRGQHDVSTLCKHCCRASAKRT